MWWNKELSTNSTEETKNDDLTCIICGEPSNGKHFCLKCYRQFSKKVLYIQVKKCKEFTKLEAEYESDFTCEDGHLVKSPYEKIIDDYLYREGIKHAYEKKIDIDETHDITPDFFIPEYNGVKNIYVEFWGYGEENIEYTRRKEYKTNLYPDLVTKDNIEIPTRATATIEFYGLGGSTSLELNPVTSSSTNEEIILEGESYRVQDFWDGQELVSNVLIEIYGGAGRMIEKTDMINNKHLLKQSHLVKDIAKATGNINTAQSVIIYKLTENAFNREIGASANEQKWKHICS